MAQRIEQVVASQRPEVIIASQLGTAIYHRHFRGVPAVFEEVEVGLQYQRYAGVASALAKFRHGLTWWKHRRFVVNLLRHFRVCTAVSEPEKTLLLKLGPRNVRFETIPNCIELAEYEQTSPSPQPDTLIFTGSFTYAPNHEAAVWLVERVWPLVKADIPGAKLMITGNPANRRLSPAEDVVLTGYVKDVRSVVAGASASVAPMLSGGGTRLKILEAMALRTPVVATRKGAEGLDVEHDTHLLLADDPAAFAGHVIRLLREHGTRQRLADSAFRLVQDKYDWSVVMPRFAALVEAAMDGHALLSGAPNAPGLKVMQ
jgi:glycosyltransferase involved in cell wall biosynthesis